MEPAQKSDFSQLRLENTQKRLSLTDMLRLFSSDYPWPRKHLLSQWTSPVIALNYLWVTTLSPRVLKSYFDWSERSDPFMGR